MAMHDLIDRHELERSELREWHQEHLHRKFRASREQRASLTAAHLKKIVQEDQDRRNTGVFRGETGLDAHAPFVAQDDYEDELDYELTKAEMQMQHDQVEAMKALRKEQDAERWHFKETWRRKKDNFQLEQTQVEAEGVHEGQESVPSTAEPETAQTIEGDDSD